MTIRYDVLIVGAGQAGAHAAIGLRTNGFSGSIALLSNESELPYERPPLSKDYLAGTKPFERLLLRPAAFWSERAIDVRGDQSACAPDVHLREVRTSAGLVLEYGTLIWASGGRPRQLSCSGATLAGVHAVRTRADVDRLRTELDSARRVVIVGGGFIGLEVAAVLSKRHSITLLEALPRVLARVCGEPISRFYEAEHRAHGVAIRTSVSVDCIEDADGRAAGVRLASGEVLAADVIIVGIGILPNVEPLIVAGAVASNGVHVDELCRTSLPDIYAIGDCAAQMHPFAGGARARLESVQNANEQAAIVAKVLCGQPPPVRGVPWFWSDQYDLKLQTIGITTGYDATVVRGDPTSRSFSVGYLRNERVIAFDCVSAPRDYVQGRKLVAESARIDPLQLADATVALKDLT